LNNWPVNILLSVYDEIQTECREDMAEEWFKKLEQIMIESAQVIIKTVPIKADCGIHDYWQK
jgi:DNA polymerase I-like protein with 3'-5' exonuclease and polymerase domains